MTTPVSTQTTATRAPSLTRSHSTLLDRRSTFGEHLCVQRDASGASAQPTAASLVRKVVSSPGQPLDAATRSTMEPRIGYDLSRVRIHTDQQAADSASAVGAHAYTTGAHVAFGAGQYSPGTARGQKMLAHELTHVAQQAQGPVSGRSVAGGLSVSDPGDRFEREAAANSTMERGIAASDGRSPGLLPLPSGSHDRDRTAVQRDAAEAFGILGAIAGVAALGIGLEQLAIAKHPPASASPTGGLILTHAQFNSLDKPAKSPDENALAAAQPKSQKILEVSTPSKKGKKNQFSVNLMMRADGHNIAEAATQEGTVEGYTGGSQGSSSTVSFQATQTRPLTAKGGESVDVVEEKLSFQGINSDGENRLQRFKGAVKVSANGTISPIQDECRITQQEGDSGGIATSESFVSVGFSDPASTPGSATQGSQKKPEGPAPNSPSGPRGPGRLNDILDPRYRQPPQTGIG